MNRKAYAGILALFTCLAFGFLMSCSSSSHMTLPPVAIAATSGSGQSAAIRSIFGASLVATVTTGGTATSGVSVTFTAPANGASGTFASTGTASETDTTNAGGQAISSPFTANATAGPYAVTASAAGAPSPATFSLTNGTGAAANLAATSGGGQSANTSTAFAAPLVATVTDVNNNPVPGVAVTFTAPASGASGTFMSTGTNTETDTTDTNGHATSTTFAANSTPGANYTVAAAAAGITTGVSFVESNTSAGGAFANYVYYLSGQDSGGSAFYAIAGAVTIDASGHVIGGEQDYNDGSSIFSPGEPNTPDTIAATSGALVVDPTTGLGTLTLDLSASNPSVGVGGVETFAIQFVNANHALISQFDGSATSSGSFDLQTATSASGSFAFAISGVNPSYDSVDFGGVYTAGSAGSITGTIDINDADGGVVAGTSFSATSGTADAFGRTVITGITNPSYGSAVTFAAYVVGPEVIRLIDVDNLVTGSTADSAVGSAFGQGTGTFDNTSLGSSVFTLLGRHTITYGTLGQFGTDGGGNITSGIADDNELDFGLQQEGASIAGSIYDLVSSGINGYGSIFMFGDGDVSTLGLYMTDPALNLNDPNNTSTDLGGALIVDLDSFLLPGGVGVITPQTDTTAADFTGNYAAGFQNFNNIFSCCDLEFDMVGPFTMTSGLLSTATIGVDDSDPSGSLTGTPGESTGDSFSSNPAAVSPGYFSATLSATINGTAQTFDADIYQASGTTLYWIEWDFNGLFLGPMEAQGSLTGVPALKRPASKAPASKAQARAKTQAIKGMGEHN